MERDISIKIKNYKCFGEEQQGFDKIMPINIIIGKNNSGKSSLIDLVRYAVERKDDILNDKSGKNEVVIISRKFTQENLREIAGRMVPTNNYSKTKIQEYYNFLTPLLNSVYEYSMNENDTQLLRREVEPHEGLASQFDAHVQSLYVRPFKGMVFFHLSSERDISPEIDNHEMFLQSKGFGATNFVQNVINFEGYNRKLVESVLLKELNNILQPDIAFSDIVVQNNRDKVWEIYFEIDNAGTIALSKMGSGVKTVLLVLLNLIVVPEIRNIDPKKIVFAFEELENNLHPAILRRLFTYIANYISEKKSILFITTHSNIVIDLFNNNPIAQIFHVTNKNNNAIVKSADTHTSNKDILFDMGIKASDILQSNGIIWVEGPSDRNYINKWISLLNKEIKEGIHYLIMFYGGRLLSNVSFDSEFWDENLIPLLRANTNAIIVMDRDGNHELSKLNQTKQRIIEEIGVTNYWVTSGREIENYLTETTINSWLEKNKKKSIKRFSWNKNLKLEDAISKIAKIDYSSNKNAYSKEIVNFIKIEDLDILNLRKHILNIIDQINNWNL